MRATAHELAPFAEMASMAIQRHYPVALITVLRSPEDLAVPSQLTPCFCGSFDWHSAVHGHWTLVRSAKWLPDRAAPWLQALTRSLTPDALAREHAFVRERPGFERPYGLAWVLQLAAELRTWSQPEAAGWSASLAPLERLAADRLLAWAEKLPAPVRSGEHSQSAFAFGLALDWARDTGGSEYRERLAREVKRLYLADQAAPVAYEPSGHDFLSPVLGEADVMRRVLSAAEYCNWLYSFLPDARDERLARWLEPATPPDRSDGKFAHLDGLNLSRAWMLQGVVSALPVGHELYSVLERASARHATAGLAGARGDDWMGTHWLGSFAVYLLSERGLG